MLSNNGLCLRSACALRVILVLAVNSDQL